MDIPFTAQVGGIALAGILAGLWLLARGFGGYRTAIRLGDTGTSALSSMAAGEVRVSGIIEPAEVTLVSPLQSEPCVYYRSSIDVDETGFGGFDEERAVGFRITDATGDVRIFPRGARWDAPLVYDEQTGSFDERPLGLHLRTGSAVSMAELDRDVAIAALLTVQPVDGDLHQLLRNDGRGRSARYRESRLAPGDPVTIVGRALPFSDLSDPAEADVAIGSEVALDDPDVAANIAEARAAGILADDPEEAWGNAAIPGFGIGRPVRPPELDPEADPLPLAPAADAERFERTFHIAPETLVLASAPDVPLLIAHGTPGAAVDRHQDRFMIGLLGAILAISSAMVFAIVLRGGFG